jgi:hypothetical protein
MRKFHFRILVSVTVVVLICVNVYFLEVMEPPEPDPKDYEPNPKVVEDTPFDGTKSDPNESHQDVQGPIPSDDK